MFKNIRRETFGEFSVLHRPPNAKPSATVHFAHATGLNAETYRALLSMLDPSLDVVAMDARGHGKSTASANPASLRSWSPFRDDLRAFIETLRDPVVLAGHSMGATVSLEVSAARPDRVRGLVLIDPVIVPPRAAPRLALARVLGVSGRMIPVSRMAAKRRMEFASRREAVDNYTGRGAFRTWPRSWVEAYVDGGTVMTAEGSVRLSCDREWESRVFAKLTVDPFRALRRARCPITLITRAKPGPPFTDAAQAAFMRRRPSTRLVEVEGATHFLVMERPDIVCAEIERMARLGASQLGEFAFESA